MSPRSKGGTGGVVAIVLAVIIGIGVSCNGFREDEVECEQAVNRLRECCSGFNTNAVDCSYSEHLDCSDSVTAREYPALSLDESRCVQSTACQVLIDTGVCYRAQNAKHRVVAADGGITSGGRSEPVCR